MAIRYDNKYTKAYHRKAKAYIGLSNNDISLENRV